MKITGDLNARRGILGFTQQSVEPLKGPEQKRWCVVSAEYSVAWTQKMWHTHTMEHHLAMKKEETVPFVVDGS